MLISILICNYNYGRFLADAIDSALAQEGPVEVIAVDDGSTDDSRAVLERYRGRIVIIDKANGGQASAFNAGVAVATGALVALLDSDDAFLPGKCARLRQAAAAAPDCGWFFHPVRAADGALRPDPAAPIPAAPVLDRAGLLAGLARGRIPYLPVPTSGLVFTRALLPKLFPMPEASGVTISDNFLKFLAVASMPGRWIAEPLALQRLHDANIYTGAKAKPIRRARISIATAMALTQREALLIPFCRRLFVDGAAWLEAVEGPASLDAIAGARAYARDRLGLADRVRWKVKRLMRRTSGT